MNTDGGYVASFRIHSDIFATAVWVITQQESADARRWDDGCCKFQTQVCAMGSKYKRPRIKEHPVSGVGNRDVTASIERSVQSAPLFLRRKDGK